MTDAQSTGEKIEIGGFIKIRLLGEVPWAEVNKIIDDDTLEVRIDNKVAGDYSAKEFSDLLDSMFGHETPFGDEKDMRLHSYKYNQIIIVNKTNFGWEPVEKH